MNEKDILLKKIQAEDFAVYETILFLDGHPCDEAALSFYHAHRDEAERLKKEYEQKYSPLTIYGSHDEKHWQWVEKPWPWEKEAN